ncbi:MAG: FkbM family methyltransferase [Gammaproteobacteria bacterium]|nr:MAG: FkbM family methyltransferase [Gammaproteobacteria bacterium]
MDSNTAPWSPPYTLEERLKYALIPAGLYIHHRVRKELRRGEPELHLLPFLADRRKISLDIGANKGVYAWMLARCSHEVHAFEPNPKLFRILQRINGPKLHVSPVALSNISDKAMLRIPGNAQRGYSNQGSSLSAVKVSGEHGEVEVETKRLDDLDLGDIGFIKIDVEGFEQAVLEGAVETLRRCRPNLLIEMEERHTHKPIEESLDYIKRLGYEGLFLRNGELVSISRFDPAGMHRECVDRPGYVFNFIFLPD